MELNGLESKKYNELWDMAKSLGIKNYGEYTGKPTKENIIDKIKLHYETTAKTSEPHTKSAVSSSASNKTPRKQHAKQIIQDLSPPVQPRNSKRQIATTSATTPGKVIKTRVEQHLHEALESNELEKPKKKTKKSSKELNDGIGKKTTKKAKKKTQVEELVSNEEPMTSATATINTEETAPQEAKALRRKQDVPSYKIDTRTKLRNEEVSAKAKSKKEVEPPPPLAEEKLVKKKKKSKEETRKKAPKIKQNEPGVVVVVVVEEEEARPRNEEETVAVKPKKKRTKKHVSLPEPMVRLLNEELVATNQEMPSPSTHILVSSPDMVDNAVVSAAPKPLAHIVQVVAKTPICHVQQEANVDQAETNVNRSLDENELTDHVVLIV